MKKVDYTYPVNIRFDCTKCGLCCGDTEHKKRHILLLEQEAQTIAKETTKPTQAFTTEKSNNQPFIYEMKKTTEGKCVFLKNNQCRIYAQRPLICRFYPFELKTENNQHIFRFTLECPSLNRGKIMDKKYFDVLFKLARQKLQQS